MPTTTTNFGLKKPLVNNPTDQDLWGGFLNDNFDTIDAQVAPLDSPTFTGTPKAPTQSAADNSTNLATTEYVDTAVGAIIAVPSGAVMSFAMSTAPSGWLECDGSAISRTTYSTLFLAIGTTFGTGDGSTTFNIPDARGEFIRGWDNGRGVDAARVFGSNQDDAFKAHTHTYYDSSSTGGGDNLVGGARGTNGTTSSTGASETRPRNIALMYCIKT